MMTINSPRPLSIQIAKKGDYNEDCDMTAVTGLTGMSDYTSSSRSNDVSIERLEEELKTSVCKENEVLGELEYMKQLMLEVSAENDELINDMHIMMEENEDLKIELDEGLERENKMAAEMEILRRKLETMEENVEARTEQHLDPEIVSEAVNNVRKTMGHKVKQVLGEKRQMEMMVEQLSKEIEIVRDSMTLVMNEKKAGDEKIVSLQSALKRCRCGEQQQKKVAPVAEEKNPAVISRRFTNISRRLSNASHTTPHQNTRRNTFHVSSSTSPKEGQNSDVDEVQDDLDEPEDTVVPKSRHSKTPNEPKWQEALSQHSRSAQVEEMAPKIPPRPVNLKKDSSVEAVTNFSDFGSVVDDDSEPFDASSQGSHESSVASDEVFSAAGSEDDLQWKERPAGSQNVSFPSTIPLRKLERHSAVQGSRRSLTSSSGKRSKHRINPHKKGKSFRRKAKAQPPQWLDRLLTSFSQADV